MNSVVNVSELSSISLREIMDDANAGVGSVSEFPLTVAQLAISADIGYVQDIAL